MRRAAWSRPAIRGASLRRALAVALITAALLMPALVTNAQAPSFFFDFDNPPSAPSGMSASYTIQQGSLMSNGVGGSQAVGITSANPNVTLTLYTLSQSVYVTTVEAYVYNSSSGNACFQIHYPNPGDIQGAACRWGSGTVSFVMNKLVPMNFYVVHVQSGFGGTRTISYDNLRLYVDTSQSPTPMPSPTPTPTPSPTPTLLPPSGSFIRPCPLLGRDADFSGFPGRWQILSESLIGYNRFQGLLMLPGHKLGIQLPLRPDVKYQISGSFYPERIVDTPRSLYVSLGASTFIVQPPLYRDESVSFEFPPATFQPGPDGTYMLILERPSTDNGLFEIKRICVSEYRERDVPISETETEDEPPAACQACDPPDSILDIFGIIGWLLCGIRNFFECVIVPFLAALARGVLDLLATALSFIGWIVRVVFDGLLWLAQIIVAPAIFVIAHIRNFFEGVNNELQVGTLASIGNVGVSYIRDLPTMLGNALFSIGNELGNVLANARSIFDLIGGLFNLFVRGLAYLITLTPLIIETLISGFNASATAISGSPICTNSSDFLYAVCLGFYVIDNTVLSGPAFYLIPVAIGLLVFDTFIWAFQAIRRAFS
jgi:hypothetical protein